MGVIALSVSQADAKLCYPLPSTELAAVCKDWARSHACCNFGITNRCCEAMQVAYFQTSSS